MLIGAKILKQTAIICWQLVGVLAALNYITNISWCDLISNTDLSIINLSDLHCGKAF